MKPRLLTTGAVLLFTSLGLGCGSSDPYGRQAVSGTVTLNGEPLQEGNIQFASTQQGPVNTGAVISKGQYKIDQEKGLPPGQYAVQISAPDRKGTVVNPAQGFNPPRELIPVEYNLQSKLKIQVQQSGSNKFDFEIKK